MHCSPYSFVEGTVTRYIAIVCVLSILVVGFVTSCSNVTEAKEVTFDQLFDNPEYNGKVVIINGFFFCGFEVHVLSERLEYSGYLAGHLVPKGRMLWVEGGIPKEVYEKIYQQSLRSSVEGYGKVRIKGKFECGGKYGHLGGYTSQIVPIEVSLLTWSPPAFLQ